MMELCGYGIFGRLNDDAAALLFTVDRSYPAEPHHERWDLCISI